MRITRNSENRGEPTKMVKARPPDQFSVGFRWTASMTSTSMNPLPRSNVKPRFSRREAIRDLGVDSEMVGAEQSQEGPEI